LDGNRTLKKHLRNDTEHILRKATLARIGKQQNSETATMAMSEEEKAMATVAMAMATVAMAMAVVFSSTARE